MMAKPSDSPGFKRLEQEWYRRLAEAGFQDIEQAKEGAPLKQSGTERRYQRMAPVVAEARAQYFRRVAQHVSETPFADDLERQILTLFAEGMPQIEIQIRLNIEGHRCRVYLPINRWLAKWGLK